MVGTSRGFRGQETREGSVRGGWLWQLSNDETPRTPSGPAETEGGFVPCPAELWAAQGNGRGLGGGRSRL